MTHRISIFLLHTILLVALTPLSVSVAKEGAWKSIETGLNARQIEASSGGKKLHLHLLRVDTTRFEFRALRPLTEKIDSVASMVKRSGAVAGINGSFFFENLEPMGLLISEGIQSHSLRKVDWGVFSLTHSGRAALVHTREWKKPKEIAFAIQTGPRLVVDQEPLTFRDNYARRSALCILAPTTVMVVGTSNAVRMRDLAVFLSKPQKDGGLGCTQALNLDGGSSTHFVMPRGAEEMGIHGFDRVPVGIGIFPR